MNDPGACLPCTLFGGVQNTNLHSLFIHLQHDQTVLFSLCLWMTFDTMLSKSFNSFHEETHLVHDEYSCALPTVTAFDILTVSGIAQDRGTNSAISARPLGPGSGGRSVGRYSVKLIPIILRNEAQHHSSGDSPLSHCLLLTSSTLISCSNHL